jgi:protocatechuate 3,4-dioxygenase alpha subunit
VSPDGDLVATPSQTVGPFFHFGMAENPVLLAQPAGPDAEVRIRLRISVSDGDAVPVPDAWIEVCEGGGAGVPLPGRLATDENGACEFEMVRAGTHLTVCVFARGLLRHVFTRVYFAGDPRLAGDPVLALVPDARRATLLAHPDAGDSRRWRFDIRLQGDAETVFFDM